MLPLSLILFLNTVVILGSQCVSTVITQCLYCDNTLVTLFTIFTLLIQCYSVPTTDELILETTLPQPSTQHTMTSQTLTDGTETTEKHNVTVTQKPLEEILTACFGKRKKNYK